MHETGLYMMHGAEKQKAAFKRQYAFNYHDNSDEFKALGSLHPTNRGATWPSQDGKDDFGTQPQIMKDQSQKVSKSDMLRGLPSDLAASMEEELIKSEGFPKTTNQDYHNDEPWAKLQKI